MATALQLAPKKLRSTAKTKKNVAQNATSELAAAVVAKPRKSKARSSNHVAQATVASEALARTFQSDSLERQFVEFCQTTSAVPEPRTVQLVRAKRILNLEIDYIPNERFELATAETEFLGERLLSLGSEEKSKPSKVPDLPPHLARLCETKLLKPNEEQSLFQRLNYLRFLAAQYQKSLTAETASDWELQRIEGLLKAADWHRDSVVKANMRLVISIVKKFVNSKNAFDDLLSDGIVALMRAVEKFDYGRGFRFSTYATQVVRRNAYRLVVQRQKERAKVNNSLLESGFDISDEDRAPSMSEHRWEDLRSRLSLLLDHLDRREKLIIRARFSLGGHRRVQTLQRLADILGVSKERVRQLEKRALDKLRGMADGMQLAELDESDE